MRSVTFPVGLCGLGPNFTRAVPPCASTRLISSTRSGARRMIIENASGLLPETRLNVSSTAAAAAAVSLAALLAEEPRERRPTGAEERCGAGGGGKERRLGAPRPSFEEAPPYMLGLRLRCFRLRNACDEDGTFVPLFRSIFDNN